MAGGLTLPPVLALRVTAAAECATAITLPIKPSAGKARLDPGQSLGWSIITAATLMTSGPLLIAFLLFQRQFVQSFMCAGIR